MKHFMLRTDRAYEVKPGTTVSLVRAYTEMNRLMKKSNLAKKSSLYKVLEISCFALCRTVDGSFHTCLSISIIFTYSCREFDEASFDKNR